MGVDRRTTLAGFAGAIGVLAALFWLVGMEHVVAALRAADPALVATVLVAAAIWLAAWALALRAVLGALGTAIPVPLAILVYAGALFANNVTPFGQAGGEPVTAYLISRISETTYETALAAIASADSLNFVPSTTIALLGLAYLSFQFVLSPELRIAATAILALAIVFPVAAVLVWRYRRRLEDAVATVAVPVSRSVTRVLPRVSVPRQAAVERRIEGFFRSIEVVARDREVLAVALGFSALGWLAQVASLWLALYALGVSAPPAAVLVAVPLGAVAGVTPLPGGLGGVEAVLVALLVPTAGVAAATAAAAVVIHRVATYWLPTLIGGGVASAIGADRRHQQP